MKRITRTTQILTCILVLACASCQPAATTTAIPEPTDTTPPLPETGAPSVPQEVPSGGGMMPVYQVVGSGPSPEQSQMLAGSLGISDVLLQDDGTLFYMDDANYLNIPSIDLGEGDPDEDGFPTTNVGLDMDALAAIEPLPDQQALDQAQAALQAADLSDFGSAGFVIGTPRVEHPTIEITDLDGNTQLEAPLDSEVIYDFSLHDRPFVGPGAKLKIAFDSQGGTPFVHYAMRNLVPGDMVAVYTAEQAAERCREAYTGGAAMDDSDLQVSGELVYFAPDPRMTSVTTIYPHFECRARATIENPDGEPFEIVPPVIYVPAIVESIDRLNITLIIVENEVHAEAAVIGGTPPYKFVWSSSSNALTEEQIQSGPVIDYIIPPGTQFDTETLGVMVSDANGLWRVATQTAAINVGGSAIQPPHADVSVGIVWNTLPHSVKILNKTITYPAAPSLSDTAANFAKEILSQGVALSLWRSDLMVRERDFRDPSNNIYWPRGGNEGPPGEDHIYIDNVDLNYTLLNGVAWLLFFPTNIDSNVFVANQASWGNQDLEWMVLGVPHGLYKPEQYLWRGWVRAFDGLHILMGYESNMIASADTAAYLASYILGDGIPIGKSWILANQKTQPSIIMSLEGNLEPLTVVMIGPYTQSPTRIQNLTDYFHGKGPVTPDIPKEDIEGWIIFKYTL